MIEIITTTNIIVTEIAKAIQANGFADDNSYVFYKHKDRYRFRIFYVEYVDRQLADIINNINDVCCIKFFTEDKTALSANSEIIMTNDINVTIKPE